ncbi:hypothetical protein LOC67_20310 [Stieleria sp. JC731]|uniref:hypothetical protein n=1 Tax=Pirellulaceae TaxID=2691357 RepID=UPI001E407210|nr:hypothetical protein [Stieleria sp. JC731]MCC9602900.1 hypothetical protein [Stieleria sp. JC731]
MKEPWFRKGRNCWFVTNDNGQQIRLDPDRKVAWELWHQLNAKEKRIDEKNPTFRELASEYIVDAKRQIRNESLTVKTLTDYVWYIDQFLERHGDMQILDIEQCMSPIG